MEVKALMLLTTVTEELWIHNASPCNQIYRIEHSFSEIYILNYTKYWLNLPVKTDFYFN